jgi:hypothetical protein
VGFIALFFSHWNCDVDYHLNEAMVKWWNMKTVEHHGEDIGLYYFGSAKITSQINDGLLLCLD